MLTNNNHFSGTSSQNGTERHAKRNLIPSFKLPILKKDLLNAFTIGKTADAKFASRSACKLHHPSFFNIFVFSTELRLALSYRQVFIINILINNNHRLIINLKTI